MTSFVHVDQPTVHPGVQRAEALIARVQAARRDPIGSRALALLAIAAMVAAVLLVADNVVTSGDESGLLAAWTVLCGAAFAVLVLFASSLRTAVQDLASAWQAGAERRAIARSDARFLATAHSDPRVMKDLQAAMTRQQQPEAMAPAAAAAEVEAIPTRVPADVRIPTLYEAMRRMNSGRYY